MDLDQFFRELDRGIVTETAEKAGVSPQFLCDVRNGRSYASPDIAEKISEATNGKVPISKLVRPEIAALMSGASQSEAS